MLLQLLPNFCKEVSLRVINIKELLHLKCTIRYKMWSSESDLQSSQNKLDKWCSGSWAHALAFSLDLNELWKLFC